MRAALLLLLGLGIACDGSAHEFWVQPGAFSIAPRTPLPLSLQVGDGALRQLSPIPLHRITRFDAVGASGNPIDLRATLAATAKRDVAFDVPGTYVLTLGTDNRAYSHQSAERFNAYLEMEGLTPALEQRSNAHQMHADGFERYSRAAKSIVLVGPRGLQSQAHVTRPAGLPLEIVPVVSPYGEPRPVRFPVRILYEGRALSGALVKLIALDQELTVIDARRSDTTGVATFAMPDRGSWLVSVAWTKPLANADADFETIFASLTFGVRVITAEAPDTDRTNP
jgi:uncharacterized GH25 family protein